MNYDATSLKVGEQIDVVRDKNEMTTIIEKIYYKNKFVSHSFFWGVVSVIHN